MKKYSIWKKTNSGENRLAELRRSLYSFFAWNFGRTNICKNIYQHPLTYRNLNDKLCSFIFF